jgi:hypothetical protein
MQHTFETERVSVELLPNGGMVNKTVFCLGSTGSGKTTLMANLIKNWGCRFVIFDTKWEYDGSFFGLETKTVKTVSDFAACLNRGERKIIFKLQGYDYAEETLSAAMIQLMEFQRANPSHPIVVALDELNRFAGVNQAPQGIVEIVQRGRGYNIQKLFGAQWFGTIPTWCRDSFSEIYVFRHNDRAGLGLLSNYGFDWEQVSSLEQYTCLRSDSKGITRITLVARHA